ncbi:uncharacterized protein LOC143447172 [Clavelina lepadiformis]|uniref:uncharacterized protein LOC143447172 n=1 Tax=Clavelina lepadiformis TaxID=159417 RepID=UPI004043255B
MNIKMNNLLGIFCLLLATNVQLLKGHTYYTSFDPMRYKRQETMTEGESVISGSGDVNECLSSPCDINAGCTNNIEGFECICRSGFAGDGFSCSDEDECLSSPCSADADCENNFGSFECVCRSGFAGDGFTCSDVNECSTDDGGCENHRCINTHGSSACVCQGSNTGTNCLYAAEQQITLANTNYTAGLADLLSPESIRLIDYINPMLFDFYQTRLVIITRFSPGSVIVVHTVLTVSEISPEEFETLYNAWSIRNPDASSVFTGPPTTYVNGLCLSFPCLNGAICNEIGTSFFCACPEGFHGRRCQNVDSCLRDPCGTNALCTNVNKTFECSCLMEYRGDPSVRCDRYCEAQQLTGSGGGVYSFSESSNGELAYSMEICPETNRSVASAFCSNSAWSRLFEIECDVTVAEVISSLPATQNLTETAFEEVSTTLQLITSSGNLNMNETESVITVLDETANMFTKNEKNITLITWTNVVVTVDNLLSSSSSMDIESNTVNTLLTTFESFNELVILPEFLENFVVQTPLISASIQSLTQSAPPEEDNTVTGTNFELANQMQNVSEIAAEVVIPDEAVQQARNQTGRFRQQIVFVVHKLSTLFPSQMNVSRVVGITFGSNVTVTGLITPLQIQHTNQPYRHEKEPLSFNSLLAERIQLACKFWDFSVNDWSSDGCCLDHTQFPPVCQCNHFTNFALLVARDVVPNDVALAVFSDVGCSLSFIALFVTFLIQLTDKERRKLKASQIFLQVCGNLMIVYILFVAGVDRAENGEACTAITALLHFFLLTSWCWMAVYSHDVYVSLVQIFRDVTYHFMLKRCLFAYGVPLIVITINLAVTVGHFDRMNEAVTCNGYNPLATSTYRADNMCWLHGYSLYFGFLLPVGILLLINVIIFITVMVKVVWKKSSIPATNRLTAKRSALISLTLFSTMGMTWIIAYLMLISTDPIYSLVMSWIFTVTSATQGIMIFIMTSVRHKDVRQRWTSRISSMGHSVIGRRGSFTLASGMSRVFTIRGRDIFSRKFDTDTSGEPSSSGGTLE